MNNDSYTPQGDLLDTNRILFTIGIGPGIRVRRQEGQERGGRGKASTVRSELHQAARLTTEGFVDTYRGDKVPYEREGDKKGGFVKIGDSIQNHP